MGQGRKRREGKEEKRQKKERVGSRGMSGGEDQLLTVKQVALKVTFSVRKIWRDVAAGAFPKPVKFGTKTTRWWKSDVEKFLRGEWNPQTA